MKRTHTSTVVAFTIVGLVIGYLGELALVTGGGKAIVPPISLAITLAGVGALVVAFAWPIRRAVKGTGTQRVDPFRAMRTAVLAKACSVSGALLFGLGIGVTLFLVTRSVVPMAGTVWLALATPLGGALLLAGGLIAEAFCTLPPDEPEKEEHAHA